ncbi:MAG: thioredoxin [Firmicutes bacterium]|nr:thioredoxin [Bacillota bacterium]MBQ3111777.1 thioredoxin [Bacillota bacterium]MBR6824855.1 thioredoxin [Bacillota bacterium]MBR7112960.1 thioredoxin [Bacillota bacterium]
MIKNITAENFSAEVLESSAPVLVDFWAPWCLPCRLLSPTLDQLAKEQPQLLIAKVNVDEQPELAAKYGVMSIPTLMVVEAGQVKLQQSGLQNKQGILAMLA